MISVTRLDGSEFIVNAELIETIEATPDTVITFAHDKKIVVREAPEEIVQRVIDFRRRMADPRNLVTSPEDRPKPHQTTHLHKGTGAQASRFRLLKQDEPDPS